jgi:AcrR family transcriptional regulator
MSKAADDTLALLLASGKTVPEAASAAGVSERTVYRRLADKPFRARVAKLRVQMLDRAVGELAAGAAEAAATLRRNLACSVPAVEVRAALGILGQVLRQGPPAQEEVDPGDEEDEQAKMFEVIARVLREGFPEAAVAVAEALQALPGDQPSKNGHAPKPRCGFVELSCAATEPRGCLVSAGTLCNPPSSRPRHP